MKHHKGDYMKCEHYKELAPGWDRPDHICDCDGDLPSPAPGWRDVREVFGLLDTATIIFRTVADNNRYHNLKDLLLPAPPEGVQR